MEVASATGTAVREVAGFEALYSAHRRHVVAYCCRRAAREEAYEAADETFLIAWRRFDEIPEGRERAWLYGVAWKVLANHHRGQRRRRQVGDRLAQTAAPFAGPEVELVRSEEHRRVHDAYLRLDPADQEVLRLAAWEELGHDQIGVALGCGTDAARQRLHRARVRLARQLERIDRRSLALLRRDRR
jgi:RNA polymerase sigma factor (sigma-70 family)